MALTTAQAAKAVCQMREWQVSNLALQKMLYVSHMVYIGRTGEPLVNETFEAWDYGPVLPNLYSRVAMFGAEPIRDVFTAVVPPAEGVEIDVLREVTEFLRPMTPGQMVALTHWEKGAWAQVYRPGVKHIPIPNQLVINEFRARQHRAG